MFSSITRAVGTCRSMNVAYAAPRLSASSPRAPVPANRSIACMPVASTPTRLKIVSRSRCFIGRVTSVVAVAEGFVPQLTAAEMAADDFQIGRFGERFGAATFGFRHSGTASEQRDGRRSYRREQTAPQQSKLPASRRRPQDVPPPCPAPRQFAILMSHRGRIV